MKVKNIILGSILFIFGLVMIILPGMCMKILVEIIGAYTVYNGITNLIGLKKVEAAERFKKTVLIKNLVSVLIGILAVLCPFFMMKTFAGIWKVISYVLSVCLIGFSITGFVSASMLSAEQKELKKHITSESFISLVIAVLMFIIPFEAVMKTAFITAGIAAIIVGLIFIVIEVLKNQKAKTGSKTDEIEEKKSPSEELPDGEKTE